MTNKEAIKILDLRKEQRGIPEDVVLEALACTGDLNTVEPPSPAIEAYVEFLRKRGVL